MNIYIRQEWCVPAKPVSVYKLPYIKVNKYNKKIYVPKCTDKLVDIVGVVSKMDNIDTIMSTMTNDQCRLVTELSNYIIFYEVKNAVIVTLLFIFLLTSLLRK